MMKLLIRIFSRMLPARYSLGIEITDSSIKMTELKLQKNKAPILVRNRIEKLPDTAVDDGRIKDPTKIIAMLKNMLMQTKVKTRDVHLVLPSQLIMVRFLKLPDISLKDLRKVVDFEVANNMHLPFESPIYDFVKVNGAEVASIKKQKDAKKKRSYPKEQDLLSNEEAAASVDLNESNTLDDENDSKNLCEVMLVAVSKELVDEYTSVLQLAKLQPISMEIKAFSLFRIIEFTQLVNPAGTFLIVDINEHITDLSIFNNSQMKITRSIPLNFTHKKVQSAPVDELKTLFAPLITEEDDFHNSCNEVAHELERLMNFYRYTLNNRNEEFDHIVLSGDVSRMSDIVDFLQDRLTVDVIVMYSDKVHARRGDLKSVFPSLAVPIGLSLRGNDY